MAASETFASRLVVTLALANLFASKILVFDSETERLCMDGESVHYGESEIFPLLIIN